jgi:hypothetical protein
MVRERREDNQIGILNRRLLTVSCWEAIVEACVTRVKALTSNIGATSTERARAADF